MKSGPCNDVLTVQNGGRSSVATRTDSAEGYRMTRSGHPGTGCEMPEYFSHSCSFQRPLGFPSGSLLSAFVLALFGDLHVENATLAGLHFQYGTMCINVYFFLLVELGPVLRCFMLSGRRINDEEANMTIQSDQESFSSNFSPRFVSKRVQRSVRH
jgi:hypothetical protein